MRLVQGLVAFGLFVAIAGAAAASQRDREACHDESGDKAIAACNRVIQDRSESAKSRAIAYTSRGFEYHHKGDYDRALADHTEAIKLDPKLADAYNNRGVTFRTKDEYARAITDYNEAIRLNPKADSYYYNRCWARAFVGRLDPALSDCNESLRLKPGDEATLRVRGLVNLKLEQFDKAIADYDAAIRINPKLSQSLYGRGWAKLKKGDTAGGEKDIAAAKAIQADIAEWFAKNGVK